MAKLRDPKYLKYELLDIPFKWFTSDHHFDHKNIIKYCNRPFASESEIALGIVSKESVNRMNEEMIRRWNEVVSPDDYVAVVGDFCLNWRPVNEVTPRLNGRKYLFLGNHDKAHPVMKKAVQWGKYYQNGWEKLLVTATLNLNLNDKEYEILVNHFPYKPLKEFIPSDHKVRYLEWRPENKGKLLIHGHVHDQWKMRDNMINVGVDVWDFYPVSVSQIADLVNPDIKKKGK